MSDETTSNTAAPKRKKATKLDKEKRVEVVRLLLLKGQDPSKIVRDIASAWGIKIRQAENYLREARSRIEAILEIDRLYLYAEHITHRRDMRERARNADDLRMELEVSKDEARLLSLYPAEQLEIRDWRKEAREDGITDVDELFEGLVKAAMDRKGQGGSVGRSTAAAGDKTGDDTTG